MYKFELHNELNYFSFLIRDLKTLSAQLPEDREKLDEIRNSLQFIQNKVDKYTSEIESLEV